MKNIPNLSALKQYLEDPLRKNAIFLMAASTLTGVLGLAFWLVVARLYSAEEVGLATAIISAMMFLTIISRLGFDVGLVRFLPQGENKRDMINSCLTVTGLFSIVLAIIFILGLNLWSPKLLFIRNDTFFFLAFILFTLAVTLAQLQEWVFIGFRSTQFTFIQAVITGLRVLLAALLIGFGTFGIFSSFGLAWCLAFIAGSLFILKLYPKYRPVPTIRKQIVNDMAHFSFGNYIATGFNALPMQIMPLIIISVLTVESSAYFFIAYSVGTILFMIPGSTGFSLLAEGSYEPAKLRSQVIKAMKFVLLLLIPGIIILFLFGELILSLFSAEYAQNSLGLLWLFALSAIPYTINILYININRVQMKVKPLIYVYAFIAVFTIGVSYSLMNWVGLIGIGIAWLSAQGIIALIVGPMMLKRAGISLGGLLKVR